VGITLQRDPTTAVTRVTQTQQPLPGSRTNSAPERPPLSERLAQPFLGFVGRESASGVLLLGCTVVALVWANSPWAAAYTYLWETPIAVGVGRFSLQESLHHWINDGLMAVFFFLVGLEIKREVLVGELASLRRAALPLAAAVGGMVVPALLFVAVNGAGPGARGWGIPMATDIAFALGILALVGPRAPLALKVFLAALAIVDDIGAVLVIAIFYTDQLSVTALTWAAGLMAALVACNWAGARHPAPYAILGLALWLAFLESGVHATVAGVLLALTIPARTRIDAGEFLARSREALDGFASAGVASADVLTSRVHQDAIFAIETAAEAAQAPLQKLEDKLHGVVAFGIMPLFALANAGVSLSGGGPALGTPIALGVVLGLVVGKPLGITLAAWLAVRTRLAERPGDVSWRMLHGAAWLGGIGFTMSLFIAGLAYDDAVRLTEAKLGILTASVMAGLVGWLVLRRSGRTA
jgi:NhaA family Na+:H+ antiporter